MGGYTMVVVVAERRHAEEGQMPEGTGSEAGAVFPSVIPLVMPGISWEGGWFGGRAPITPPGPL